MGAVASQRVALSIALLLLAPLAGCSPSEPGEPKREGALPPVEASPDAPDPGASPAAAVPEAAPGEPGARPTAAELRGPMLAIYARVVEPPEFPLPPALRPIPLEVAGRIVVRDATTSHFGESRRRRAIRRITVAALRVHDDFTFHLECWGEREG